MQHKEIKYYRRKISELGGNVMRMEEFSFFNSLFLVAVPSLEKEMATHSSVLAWRIPGTEEPGGLPSMGLHRVAHN